MFSSEYCEIFKNIYIEEHLQTTVSEKTESQQIKACVYKRIIAQCAECEVFKMT